MRLLSCCTSLCRICLSVEVLPDGSCCQTATSSNHHNTAAWSLATCEMPVPAPVLSTSNRACCPRPSLAVCRREMVNDVRDVIVSGTRAAARNYRLESSGPLVYGFMIAPSYVVAP